MPDVRNVELHEFVMIDGKIALIGGWSDDPAEMAELEAITAHGSGPYGDSDKVLRYQRRTVVVEMPDLPLSTLPPDTQAAELAAASAAHVDPLGR